MRKLIRSKAILGIVVAAIAVSTVIGIGVVLRGWADATAAVDRPPGSTIATTAPPTTTTTVFVPPPLVQPDFVELPDVGAGIGQGDAGMVVAAYQQRLVDLRFDPGEVDGVFDQPTRYAVEGLQKTLGVEPTGRIAPDVALMMMAYQFNEPLEPYGGGARTEIDVTRQVITVYSDWQVALITTTSTGGGHRYCYDTPRVNPTMRVCEDANTPSGSFEYYEYRPGWDPSPLGRLYNPVYFNGGIAVHGYDSVPTTPQSSGCARIPMHTAEHFPDMVDIGDPVFVFGGTDAFVHSRTPLVGRAAPEPPPPPPPEIPPPPPPPEIAPAPPPPATPSPPPTRPRELRLPPNLSVPDR